MMLVTADHGNAERMIDEQGKPVTKHTTFRGRYFILMTLYQHIHCAPSMVWSLKYRGVQKVLYTAQNVRWRVGCAKSALYSTNCMLENGTCKKCSIQHKMYAREYDVRKVLYTAQNVRLRVGCAKTAIYSTKCMHIQLVSRKKCIFVVIITSVCC